MDDKMVPSIQKELRICDRHKKTTANFVKVLKITRYFFKLVVWLK
jgi:hypothetical protein